MMKKKKRKDQEKWAILQISANVGVALQYALRKHTHRPEVTVAKSELPDNYAALRNATRASPYNDTHAHS